MIRSIRAFTVSAFLFAGAATPPGDRPPRVGAVMRSAGGRA
ncbi:MAG: hypothetical protein WD534_08495 [Phycisphaeraceae bacterium]